MNALWIEQLTHELNDALAADEDEFAGELAWTVAARAFCDDEDREPLTKRRLLHIVLACIDEVGCQSLDTHDVTEALDRTTSISCALA